MPELFFKKKWHVLSVTLCTLSAFLLLFIFRDADDNRLTSWKWTFADVELIWFLPLILSGIVFIYILLNLPVTRQRPSLFLVLFSFAVSTIFWKAPEVIVDTSRYFTQSKHLEIYGITYFFSQWGSDIHAWTDLPFVPFLYGLIFTCFGEARAFIQVCTTFAFSMTSLCTYLIGRTLWDEETGFFAGALLLGIPYIFSQVPLMLVDILTMFFLTLSIFTFLKALQNGGVWIPVSAIAVFSAVFSKYSVWIMLSVLGAVFLVYVWKGKEYRIEGADNGRRNLEQGTRTYIYRAAWVALLGGVLIGAVLLLKYDIISEQINFLREYQSPGLRRWGESFISTFLYQTHPFITVAAVSSIYVAFKKRDVKFIIIAWLILIVVILQIRRSRYVMIVFPMFTLMASYGLQQIRSMELKRYIVSCIMASSIIVAVFSYLPFLQSMSAVNLKNAGSFLNSIEANKIEVFTIPSTKSAVNSAVAVPMLDLFTDKDILYRHDKKYSLPFEKIEKSSLRFTWEYKNPKYYMDEKKGLKYPAIVVISNRGEDILPERIKDNVRGYEPIKTFETTTDLFRYSPVVTIYVQKKLK